MSDTTNDILESQTFEPRAGETSQVGRLIRNDKLKKLQHVNSFLFTALGLGGVAAGIYRALYVQPLTLATIGIFLSFFVLIGLGITAGFHRHFTHRSFKAKPAVRVALAVLGCMAGQGPVVFWVALHRMHHEYADKEGDPHSPNLAGSSVLQKAAGLWHAYLGWTIKHEVPNANFYARDILRDPLIMAVNRQYYLWILIGLLLPAAIGGAITHNMAGAIDGFVWGGLVRMFAVHNIIWWITSFAHVFGRRDFESRDRSTNSGWIALPTLGESWHNNHHAFPAAAILWFRWWQVDIAGGTIRLLEILGLAWDVRRPSPSELERKRITKAAAQNL
jgi:stearoyl-CoA desaturase (delta-9 desaturase)